MAIERTEGGTMITGPDIHRTRLIALRGRLKLETLGLHFKGRPSSVIIRELTGLKARNKLKLLAEYDQWLTERGLRQP
jgi:hypothetical protein